MWYLFSDLTELDEFETIQGAYTWIVMRIQAAYITGETERDPSLYEIKKQPAQSNPNKIPKLLNSENSFFDISMEGLESNVVFLAHVDGVSYFVIPRNALRYYSTEDSIDSLQITIYFDENMNFSINEEMQNSKYKFSFFLDEREGAYALIDIDTLTPDSHDQEILYFPNKYLAEYDAINTPRINSRGKFCLIFDMSERTLIDVIKC